MAPTKDAQRLRRAAERQGKAEDQYHLGCLLYNGDEGLKVDKVAAVKWWSKAAAQEHARAQCDLGKWFSAGECFSAGEGVEQNHELAASWLGKAADQGDVSALGHLGCLYAEGKGVAQDDAMAVACWEKAAVGDDRLSQFNLGHGYMHGEYGLPKDAHCAKIYMMAAAAQGNAKAIEALKLLNACAACGTPDASRACQGCRSATGVSTVRYCNPSCQTTHRKAHKPDCGPCQCHRCK